MRGERDARSVEFSAGPGSRWRFRASIPLRRAGSSGSRLAPDLERIAIQPFDRPLDPLDTEARSRLLAWST
jgi:hypothetical protein